MAPSTPPPPSSDWFAALTMASTSSVVMSATRISSSVAPTVAVSSGCWAIKSRPVSASLQAGERLDGLRDDVVGIERGQSPALFEDAPVDDHGIDIVRLRRPHDGGDRIPERRHVEVGRTH